YPKTDPQTWGLALFRNYPRDFRYQIASVRFPRGSNCTVCLFDSLAGLEHLPRGGHVIAAPYVTASQVARPANGLGTPLANGSVDPNVGFDAKWTPNADNAVDVTANPDFSQIEAD